MGREKAIKRSGATKKAKKKAAIRGGVKNVRKGVSRAKGRKRP